MKYTKDKLIAFSHDINTFSTVCSHTFLGLVPMFISKISLSFFFSGYDCLITINNTWTFILLLLSNCANKFSILNMFQRPTLVLVSLTISFFFFFSPLTNVSSFFLMSCILFFCSLYYCSFFKFWFRHKTSISHLYSSATGSFKVINFLEMSYLVLIWLQLYYSVFNPQVI